jgi:hypothetical protein
MPPSPEDIYKEEITNVVRNIKDDPTLQINFNSAKLSQHVATDKQARVAMIGAASASARRFRLSLNEKGVKTVFDNVSRSSTYASVLGTINTALTTGADPVLP